jgi:transcriptional regulator with XRE-family HTH domain
LDLVAVSVARVPPKKLPIDPWLMSQRLAVGDRLRRLREWRNLRQSGLAELVGLSRYTVYRVELGTVSMTADQAHLFARALDVPVGWLFTDVWIRSDDPSDVPRPTSSS